jgi:HlyD family secretion protein
VRWKRWLFISLVATAVVLLIAWGYRPRPALVEAGQITRGTLLVTVVEEGKTRVTDRFVVSAPVAGYARRLPWKVGDAIRRGQQLLEIEPLRPQTLDPRSRAEAQARVAAAEAALRQAREQVTAAEADAAYWEAELARVRKLLATGDVPKDRFDRTLTESRRSGAARRAAEHAVELAASELEAAKAALKYSAASPVQKVAELVSVHSPAAGRVLKVIRESEGVVNPGEPLLEIGNARSLEVEVEVLSEDAVKISPGMRVIFERWGGPYPLEGRVRRVEPHAFTKISALGVEEQRVRVISDITSPPEKWDRLGDGYRIEASFVLWEGNDVLLAPASALFRLQDGWAVFAIEQGTARRRPVQIGQRNGLLAEILSGLAEGDTVITHPDSSIADGALVQIALRAPVGGRAD